MKTGIVLEGGASRTIYSCGVLDALLDSGIYLDYVAGASAGISYGVSYISRQSGRNLAIAEKYMADKRYMGVKHLFNRKNRSYYNLDFVFGSIPEELVPFDFEEYRKNGEEAYGALTDIETGETVYMKVPAEDRKWMVLRGSCALPLLFQPVEINGRLYMDGGITDSIPFRYAMTEGKCDKVIVILTRPRGYTKSKEKLSALVKMAYPKYPLLGEKLSVRHEMYNRQLSELYELEKEGRALIISPSDTHGIGRTERKPEILVPYYKEGYEDTIKDIDIIRNFIEK